jgi:hypothetical protein
VVARAAVHLGPDGVDRSRAGFFAAVRLSPYEEAVCGLTSVRTRTPGRAARPAARHPHQHVADLCSTTTRTAGRARRWHPPPIARPTCRPPTATTPSTASGAWRAEAVAAAQAALGDREILIADGHHRYETALAYRDEQRERDGDPAGDQPYDFVLMYLANLHGEGLAGYPTHRVVMAQREVDPRFLAAFAVRELPAGTSPAQVESQLDAIDPATVAFALWRGSDRPALIAQVKDTSTVMMAMPAHQGAARHRRRRARGAGAGAAAGPDGDQFLTTDQVRYVRGWRRPLPWSIRARPAAPSCCARPRSSRCRRWRRPGA